MNAIVIVGCLMAGATLGVCIMACFVAGSQADDWSEQYEAQSAREEVEKRTLYREQRKAAQ